MIKTTQSSSIIVKYEKRSDQCEVKTRKMMSGMMPGGNTSDGAKPNENGNQITDLSTKFDKSKCYARNESSQYPMTNLFIGDSSLGCKSDADEQLILHIEFQEHVRVRMYTL